MRFRITAAVQAGLARDAHKLAHLDVIVGYRHTGVNPEPDAMLRSVTIDTVRDGG